MNPTRFPTTDTPQPPSLWQMGCNDGKAGREPNMAHVVDDRRWPRWRAHQLLDEQRRGYRNGFNFGRQLAGLPAWPEDF